jgi:hypothetical protein
MRNIFMPQAYQNVAAQLAHFVTFHQLLTKIFAISTSRVKIGILLISQYAAMKEKAETSGTGPAAKTYKSHLGGVFSGQRETLVAILDPHVANWVKNKTHGIKRNLDRIGELRCRNLNCKVPREQIGSLDTAHPVHKSRPEAILDAINALYPCENSDGANVLTNADIAAVLAKTKEIHLAMSITFLCSDCNKKHPTLSSEAIESKTIGEWAGKTSKGKPGRQGSARTVNL